MMTDIYKSFINEEDSEDCKSSLFGKNQNNIIKKIFMVFPRNIIDKWKKRKKMYLLRKILKIIIKNNLEAIKELNINDISNLIIYIILFFSYLL